MLSDQEKYLLAHFLEQMEDSRLMSLSGTVTMGRIKYTTREEAVKCILLHATSLIDIFNFKRINTTVLLKYLHHLNESIPGTASKDMLIRQIFQKWNIPYPTKSQACEHVITPEINPYAGNFMSQNGLPAVCLTSTSVTKPTNNFQMMSDAVNRLNTNCTRDPLAQMIQSKELLKEVNTLAFNEYIVGFAKTFYNLLNTASGQYEHGFNNTHFFGECKLKIMIKGATEDIELEGEGIMQVLNVLSDLKKEHQLYFSPNLTEQGVRSKQDNHGLISAVVCGTLHQRSGPVGVFEQCFIIAPDPFARESYKIQETVLILRSSNAVSSYSQLMIASENKSIKPIGKQSHLMLASEFTHANLYEESNNCNAICYNDH